MIMLMINHITTHCNLTEISSILVTLNQQQSIFYLNTKLESALISSYTPILLKDDKQSLLSKKTLIISASVSFYYTLCFKR